MNIAVYRLVLFDKHRTKIRVGVWLFVALAVLILVPLMVVIDSHKPDIEAELSAAFQRKVTIGSLRIGIFPRLRLVARDVRIAGEGNEGDAVAEGVYIGADMKALWSGNVKLHYVHLDKVKAHQRLLMAFFKTLNTAENTTHDPINIDTISASPVTIITDKQKELMPLSVTIALTPDGSMKVMSLAQLDNSFQLMVTPHGDKFKLTANAKDWTLPYGPPIKFEHLTASGIADGNRLVVNRINAGAYKGTLSGKGEVGWRKRWTVKATGRAEGVYIRPLLKALGEKILSGRFKGDGSIKLTAKDPVKLLDNPRVNGNFRFTNGVIYKADLEKATSIIGKQKSGGTTRFDVLSGKVSIRNRHTTVKNLHIVSKALEAKGRINVKPNDKLKGELDVGLKKSGGILTIPLEVAGTVDEPKIRPTKEAVVGGAVGTAVLGPGLGTAIGVKAGKFFKDFGKKVKEALKNNNTSVWDEEEEESY